MRTSMDVYTGWSTQGILGERVGRLNFRSVSLHKKTVSVQIPGCVLALNVK